MLPARMAQDERPSGGVRKMGKKSIAQLVQVAGAVVSAANPLVGLALMATGAFLAARATDEDRAETQNRVLANPISDHPVVFVRARKAGST
jgi:hypothetical protein